MPIIGTLTRSPDGRFAGTFHTLTIQCPLAILPARRPDGSGPDYRVVAGTLDIGSGWIREDDATGARTISLALAMPEFGPRRLYCQIVPLVGEEPADRVGLRWIPLD